MARVFDGTAGKHLLYSGGSEHYIAVYFCGLDYISVIVESITDQFHQGFAEHQRVWLFSAARRQLQNLLQRRYNDGYDDG